jgi:hypothetical protein
MPPGSGDDERVAPDDWHPSSAPEARELDWQDTLGKRRTWYANLLEEGLRK